MKIKPLQISIFLILLLSVLFGITFLSTKGAIKKNQIAEDGFFIEGISIKYPTYDNFLGLVKTDKPIKEDVLKVTKMITPIDNGVNIKQDSIAIDSATTKDNSIKLDFSKIDSTQIQRIAYPNDNIDFIKELKAKLSSRSCRIIHYGDSQIEGDRITGYLRNRLQGMYGGNGPGFLPLKPVYEQNMALIVPSVNWLRYARFDPSRKRFKHKKYGVYMSVSRFTDYQEVMPDSIALDSLPIVNASVTIGKSKTTYRRFRKFNNISLHYGNCAYPIKIKVYNDGKLIQEDDLITDSQYHRYRIKTANTPNNLKIEFEGKISADFYGLTLDGASKVQIDNVAMRGASGTIFTSTSNTTFNQMANVLKPKIIIMQYGGNAVPYLKDSTKIDSYVKSINRQANWLKRRSKNANIIFIGPTDMCLSVNGSMETYPLLPYLNSKLMETCLENNIAYWSMFDAMGGKGAMPFWVEEKLAGNDYTHFTRKGTKIISELFFTALYLDLKDELE